MLFANNAVHSESERVKIKEEEEELKKKVATKVVSTITHRVIYSLHIFCYLLAI